MLDGRVRVWHPRRLLPEREELVDVAPIQGLGRPLVEVDRPLRGAGLAHEVLVDEWQPVGEEAAPDDQHALVAQRRQAPPDFEEVPRVEVRHRQLEDRDVRVGVHRLERHPRPVVESAHLPVEDRFVSGHQALDGRGELGGGRGVVRELVVLRREAVEVVDQRDPVRRAQGHRRGLPVGADDQDLLRAGHRRGPAP